MLAFAEDLLSEKPFQSLLVALDDDFFSVEVGPEDAETMDQGKQFAVTQQVVAISCS